MIQSYLNKNLLEIVLKNNLIVYIHVVNVDNYRNHLFT